MASRMGYDLTTKMGWKNLQYSLKFNYRGLFKLVLTDTFTKFYCWVVGHRIYDSEGEKACNRCWHYIK